MRFHIGPVGGATVTRGADTVSLTVPAGTTRLVFTFDDGSTQQVSVAPGAYTVPAGLARARIRTITGLA